MAFMGPGAPREGASRYTVTSADGQWLGTVTAPPGLRILDAAHCAVLVGWRGRLGRTRREAQNMNAPTTTRPPASADQVRKLTRLLGDAVRSHGRIYLVGCSSAVLPGWRETTTDIGQNSTRSRQEPSRRSHEPRRS